MLSSQLRELRRVVRLHTNWFVMSVLGKDALTPEELRELEDYGKLSMSADLGLVEKSFILGRLKLLLKKREWKDLSYEELKERVRTVHLSPLEKLALQQARLHAADNVKNLAHDIASGLYSKLSQAMGQAVSEASVKEVIRDEVELAIINRRKVEELATGLATKLKDDWSRDWRRVAATELHSAKMQGAAQAIINRVDVFAGSDGVDSQVSIVPDPKTCEDCSHHYLDTAGNPKVFTLKDLLNAGSNTNVSHKRAGKIHAHWKTTLPPIHPSCQCSLVYIPKGMGWQAGKLVVADQNLYSQGLVKSQAGVSGGISSTVKPAGPPKPPEAPKAPSLPGIAAPGNVPGPGRPKGSGSTQPTASNKPQMVACPFGGGEECEKAGGTSGGSEQHEAGSEVLKKHAASQARGQRPSTPEGQQQLHQQTVTEAVNWSKQKNPDQVVLGHLSHGEVTTNVPLGKDKDESGAKKGISDASRITIAGNGRALMKTPYMHDSSPEQWANHAGDGFATIPHGTHHRREEAAYKLSVALGANVPPTATRAHEGHMVSTQHWLEDHVVVGMDVAGSSKDASEDKGKNDMERLLSRVPAEHKDKVTQQLMDMSAFDIVMNNNDRHSNNIMINKDYTDVKPIDHGLSFGNGLEGHKNVVLQELHNSGRKVRMSSDFKKKIDTMSYGDVKRSLGNTVEDWASGQTYLRMKYVSHLQDTDGHIDFEKVGRSSYGTVAGAAMPHKEMWKDVHPDKLQDEYWGRMSKGHLPNQRFESFAKKYIRDAMSDESHPDHETAKELDKVGIFMGPGAMRDPHAYRREGKHKAYEDKILSHTVEDPKVHDLSKEFAEMDESGGTTVGKKKAKAKLKVDQFADTEVGAIKSLFLSESSLHKGFPASN